MSNFIEENSFEEWPEVWPEDVDDFYEDLEIPEYHFETPENIETNNRINPLSKNASYKEIFNADPMDIIEWASEEFDFSFPMQVSSTYDMEEASKLIIKLSAQRAYLNELLAYAKVAVRNTKRNGTKEEWEDMVDRKDILERFLKIADDSYTALSRVVTIKISNDKELYMNDSGTF